MKNLLRSLSDASCNHPWALVPGAETSASIIWALRQFSDTPAIRLLEASIKAKTDAARDKSNNNNDDDDDEEELLAIVPIKGVLMRSANFLQRMFGASSYSWIQGAFKRALRSKAKTILLNIDSPGGDVMGCQQTANLIYEAASGSQKTIVAFTQGQMCSAAYWLGSQANEVIATPDANVGSVGVIARIVDTSRREKNEGEDSTVLTTGANKGMGIGPVSASQMQVLHEMMTEAFDSFVKAVERGRNATISDEVKTGRAFTGASGLRAGLVDSNSTFEEVVANYASRSPK